MAVVRAQEAPFSSSRCTYDVFLSFRGKDVRKTFMDHLYTALVPARFRTFRDDEELKRGENIKFGLEESIQQSRISIVVLSKEYAFSRWCLDELLMILDCRRTFGQFVLPVFYHVHPYEVRKQNGQFEEAFRKYEEQFNAETDHDMKRERMDKVKRWREALKEVADLVGMDLQNQSNGHESNFIQKIVKVISDKLNRTAMDLACNPVGIHSRAQSVNLWVQDESASVNIYVIWGMGGIGKTTIAKYIYNLNNGGFGCKSFLANIRETSEKPNGLLGLQKQILSEILKTRKIKVSNVDEGIAMIKAAISCEKVFLVLDDVNEVNQLDALLGTRKFYPGSKIIITTRDRWLQKAHEVHKTYEVEKLDDDESLELFTQHAFGQDHTLEGYAELSKRVVQNCAGLPLAHKVLGSSLSGKSVDVWESALKKLEAIPDAQILNKLKVSYDSLQDVHDKKLFLHIACFFVGKAKDDTVKILDGCGFFTIIGIENLTDRCLITIAKDNTLMMHQLIKEMGRDIVYRESPEEPEKRSRLWYYKDSFKVLKKRTGTKAIEGLILDMRMFPMENSASSSSHVNNVKKRQLEEFASVSSSKRRCLSFISWLSVDTSSRHQNEVDLKACAFAGMKKLKLLNLNYVKLTGGFVDFPRNLRWLSWQGFPLKSIPVELSLTKVVILDMSYSRLERVWDGIKLLGSLKILNLSYSIRLSRTPDFSALLNVEKVILTGCVSLVEICESIGHLEGLTLLDLKDCKSLRKFPNINNLKFLETLIISGCSSLGGFPTSLSNMKSLKVLNADGIAITDVKVKSWHPFAWSWVLKPRKSLEMFLPSLPHSLVSLSLAECNLSNDSFPKDFSNLSSLRCLNLSGNPIVSLPDCVGNVSTLQKLYLNSCKSLKNVLGLPSVERLQVGGSTSLQRITYKSAASLRPDIEHTNCLDLVEIHGLFKLQPIGEVDRELINNMGWFDVATTMGNAEVNLYNSLSSMYSYSSIKKRPIQGLYEFGIFNTFLPGREVPGWFSDKRTGSSISFTVPSLLQGLNLCFVYAHSDREICSYPPPIYCKISNKTKDLHWVYGPKIFGVPDADEDLLWLSHWKFGSQLESGDLIDVKIVVGDCFQVKECGIGLVCSKQKEKNQHKFTHLSWKHVVGGDLSPFQLSTGVYFLCHESRGQYLRMEDGLGGTRLKDGPLKLPKFKYDPDWTRASWFQDLCGDSISYEGVAVTWEESLVIFEDYIRPLHLSNNFTRHTFNDKRKLHVSVVGDPCPVFVEPQISWLTALPQIARLPLAHKVLGSSLSGKSVDVWESALKKLEAIPDAQILNKLKVSYDSLQDVHDKKLFLHIACFFVGKAKDDTVKILDGCGFFTIIGIENLTDRCLITIAKDNTLMMHQLIKEMGRDIVYRESPEEPEKRSRLWYYKDSFKVLKKRTGTKAIEGLILDMRMFPMENSASSSSHVNNVKKRQLEEFASVSSSKRRCLSFISWLSVDTSSRHQNEVDLKACAFAGMKKLKLLNLNYVKLTGGFVDFPRNLRWLSWQGFPLKSIPVELSLTKVVILDMSYSRLERVWDGIKLLGSLKILNLSYSIRLSRTPDFSALLNVEKVILTGCVSLVEICESIGHLEGLTLLDLKGCKSLRKFPNIDTLKFLETLIISGCSSLGGFPTSLSNMKSLKVLNADGIAITDVKVKSWHPFAWSWVLKPRKSLEMFLPSLPHSLVSLSLAECNLSNDSFPKDFSNLSSLRCLNLSGNPIVSLPDCVGNVSTLQKLYLNSCKSLKNVLGLPSVERLRVGGCTSLQRITYKSAASLRPDIEHTNCLDLVEIHGLFKLQPIGEVDRELINNMGWFDVATTTGNAEVNLYNSLSSMYSYSSIKKRPIQGLYEFGIFNTFLPGREVPGWFSDKRMGSSISFTVPSLPDNLKIQGLNLCLVYASSKREEYWFPTPLYSKISNKTKDLHWVYGPKCFGFPEADEELLWLSHWKFGSQLESGDLIDVKIVVGDCFQVKECGIGLVCSKQKEENQHKFTHLSWKHVVGGDLSPFQLSTGVYFLCHKTRDQYLYSEDGVDWTRLKDGPQKGQKLKDGPDWTRASWFQDLCGDSISYEEVRHWGWDGRDSGLELRKLFGLSGV